MPWAWRLQRPSQPRLKKSTCLLDQLCERTSHRLYCNTFQVLEHCIARLDVALFNALLRDPRIDGPTDPISDPLTEPRALPIPAGKLTFGGETKRVYQSRTGSDLRFNRWSFQSLLTTSTQSHSKICSAAAVIFPRLYHGFGTSFVFSTSGMPKSILNPKSVHSPVRSVPSL